MFLTTNFKILGIASFIGLNSLTCFATNDKDLFNGVQSKERLIELVSQNNNHYKYQFIKDLPIYAYEITSSKLSDIPTFIRSVLGAVDDTKKSYTEEYLEENIGSVIALQMKDDEPDFYIIDKKTFQDQYEQIDLKQVSLKNPKLDSKLRATAVSTLLDGGDVNVKALLKTVPVEMVQMSQIGYAIDKPAIIESPWGEQTKPAGKDAFLAYNFEKKQYYMINVDERGLPIGYVFYRSE